MATRYTAEATKQLAPVYDQQIKAAQAQIPALQQLYQTLTQGLQQQNQQQLVAGTQNIIEDASARGVLRSTLPVDARQALTAQLGSALNQSLGQIGLEQTRGIADINQQVGGLRINRANAVADLARALQTRDLEERQFRLQQLQANREYQLQQQRLALERSSRGGSAPHLTNAQRTQQAVGALAGELKGVAGPDGYVSPQDYAAARREWVGAGFSTKSFEDYFAGFKNPQNNNYQYF